MCYSVILFFFVLVGRELSATYFSEPAAEFVTCIAALFKVYIIFSLVLWKVVKKNMCNFMSYTV